MAIFMALKPIGTHDLMRILALSEIWKYRLQTPTVLRMS